LKLYLNIIVIEKMYQLQIFKSYGGETPLVLIGTYIYSSKELAISTAMSKLPAYVNCEWVPGNTEDDVKFNFNHSGQIFQFFISKVVLDIVPENILYHLTIFPKHDSKKGYYFD